MTDEQDLRDKIDALRIQIEQNTLQNETYRTYLQGWQIQVSPIHEEKERSRELSSGFAQMGIKSMFILNGGSLIALPAFAEIANKNIAENIPLFVGSISCFVVGLALTALATLFAYLSLDANTAELENSGTVVRFDLIKGRDPAAFSKDQEQERETSEKERQRFNGLTQTLALIAMRVAIASLVAFIAGAGLGILILV